MPFVTTTTPPSINPPIKVEFAGLMLLSGVTNTCEVGVHRWTSTHSFQVSLIVSKPPDPVSGAQYPPTMLRIFTGPLDDDFEIALRSITDPPAPDPADDFKAYAAAGAFTRDYATAASNPLDFRWALNLRGKHPEARRNKGAEPIIKLKTGVLYTPTLTLVDLEPKLIRNTTVEELYRFAADLAVAIQRPANTNVRLKWIEKGEERTLTLPRRVDPDGTKYVISVMNDPPMSVPETHDEIADYYKILTVGGALIPAAERWRLQYQQTFERTDEIPCMPGTLEP